MKVILLAGGLGTRLRQVVQDCPKPMAPVGGRPFLLYVMDALKAQGASEFILSVHYLYEQIIGYLGHVYQGIPVRYSIEEHPLGTGGAIQQALASLTGNKPVLVLNGDTFLDIDYRDFYRQHVMQNAPLSVALRFIENASRYGVADLQEDKIVGFVHRGKAEPGYINAGVYAMEPDFFESYAMPEKFSFEEQILGHPALRPLGIQGVLCPEHSYFIDIGVPEDYARAQKELPEKTMKRCWADS